MRRHPGITRLGPRRYRVRVQVTDPRTRARKEVDRRIEGILADALEERERLRGELLGEGMASPSRTSLGEYAAAWSKRRAPRLRKSTRDRYAVAVAHITIGLGAYRLGTLRPGDVEEWLAAQVGRGDAPSSVNGRLRVLRSICRAAARDFQIGDPTSGVAALPEGDPDRATLGAAELRKLLEHVERADPKKYPLLLVLALTGLRWGEATALRWEDIDEADEVIRVRRAHYRGAVGPTKSGRPRVFPLVAELAEALRRHRRRRIRAEAKVKRPTGNAAGWCFTVPGRGRSWALPAPSSWAVCLPAWCGAVEVPVVTPHSFRRSWVDLARQTGAHLMVARSLVGHAGDRVHERYSTVATEEQRAVAGAVLALVRAPKGGDDA